MKSWWYRTLPSHEIGLRPGDEAGNELHVILDVHVFGILTVLDSIVESRAITLILFLSFITDEQTVSV